MAMGINTLTRITTVVKYAFIYVIVMLLAYFEVVFHSDLHKWMVLFEYF